MINSIELFSGAGGLAKGLELAGAHHHAFIEWNSDACKTLRQNYNPKIVFEGDVRNVDFDGYEGIDIIAGGPPCQPFSLGGKAKGMDDERDMFPYAVNAIRKLTPKAFIFENVKGLLRESFSEYFHFILLQLKYPEVKLDSEDWRVNNAQLNKIVNDGSYSGVRYDVQYQLVNAADYGVPQKRERVIIVGFRHDLDIQWNFPLATHSEDALLWQKYVTGKYWERHGLDTMDVDQKTAKRLGNKLLNKYGMWAPELQPWQTIRDALVDLHSSDTDVCAHSEAKEYPGHTGSLIDEPSKTIKAGAHGVPGGENMIKFNDNSVRYLTIPEAKRIQTFPDDYIITGAWSEAMRQLGNAVPVRLAEIIAKSVIEKIEQQS